MVVGHGGTIDIAEGNQHAIFAGDAAEKAQGVDLASAEERNRIWMAYVCPDWFPSDRSAEIDLSVQG